MKRVLIILISINLIFTMNGYGATKHDYKAAILIEANTGKILYKYNKDEILPQASITKLMTYYAFKGFLKERNIKENSFIKVENDKFNIPSDGVKINLKKGELLSVKDLLNTMLIISANDSAVEVEHIYEKNNASIINSMNNYCKLLGLTNSHYFNVTGITIKNGNKKICNTTTVYDTSKLASIILKKYPEILKITSKKKYKFRDATYGTTNMLLYKSKNIDGLKTGYTDAAGYCVVSTENVTKLIGNGKYTRLLAVVFGCSTDASRVKESMALLKFGEENYINDKVISKGSSFKIKNDYYNNGYLNGTSQKDIYILKNNKEKLVKTITLKKNLQGDVRKGDLIGTVYIKVGNEKLKQNIYASSNCSLKPWYVRVLLSIRNFFKSL